MGSGFAASRRPGTTSDAVVLTRLTHCRIDICNPEVLQRAADRQGPCSQCAVRRPQISDVASVVSANTATITPIVEQQCTELARRDVGTVGGRMSVTHFREFRLFAAAGSQIVEADSSVLVGARLHGRIGWPDIRPAEQYHWQFFV
jgi:hypothetical protein